YLLGLYFYEQSFLAKAKQMMQNMSSTIINNDQPNFYSNWCSLYSMMVHPPYEVAIVGENYADLRSKWQSNYLPNAILLGGKNEGTLELLDSKLQEGLTMIYVCQNKVCKFPVEEVGEAIKLLD
ncbi:MAG: thioredoxin domain-containing protein, partial [Bacteroidota bacterium]